MGDKARRRKAIVYREKNNNHSWNEFFIIYHECLCVRENVSVNIIACVTIKCVSMSTRACVCV